MTPASTLESKYFERLRHGLLVAAQSISEPTTNDAEYISEYQHTRIAVRFYGTLGRALAAAAPLSVLDVGSGTLCIASMLMAANKNVAQYTAVDIREDASKHVSKISDHIERFSYIREDYQNLTADHLIPDAYDVVIIDVEPHGRDGFVYSKVKPFMKPHHLCICSCLGAIDCYCHGMADAMIDHLMLDRCVFDYFGQVNSSVGWRDVLLVMSKTPIDPDLRCQELAVGKPSGRVKYCSLRDSM